MLTIFLLPCKMNGVSEFGGMLMKIAIRRVPFTQEQKEQLQTLAEANGCRVCWLQADDGPEALADCEVLMGGYPAAWLKDLPNLKWLQTCAAGVEQYCAVLPEQVLLTNGSGAFGIAMAEYSLCGLLMLMRLMPAYAANQRDQAWRCMGLCRSIAGSVITVVGTGNVGSAFAERAKALGAHIRGVHFHPGGLPSYYDEEYLYTQLREAVRDADAVVLCLPGTRETVGLISEDVIAAMVEKTIVVNCGRGRTVDQAALTKALQEKRIAGAVLDVFEQEPLPADDPLWSMENVIITPHISGHDDDPVNARQIFDIFMTNLRHWFRGEELTHVVDKAAGY